MHLLVDTPHTHTRRHIMFVLFCLPVNKQVCVYVCTSLRVCCSLELWKYFNVPMVFIVYLSSHRLNVCIALSLSLSLTLAIYLFIHCIVSLKFRYFMFSIDTCMNVDTIYVDRLAVTEFNIHYFRRHFFGQMIYS